jgi:hypothetical protein
MKRVLMLVVVTGAVWLTAPAPRAAAAQETASDRARAGGVAGERTAARCGMELIRTANGLDWCHSRVIGLGVRRSEDGGDGDDDNGNERGHRDADGGPYDDGGRYADDPGVPRDGGERWERADWGDLRFRFSGTVRGRELSATQLESLLGRGVVARLTRHAWEEQVEGALQGRWLDDEPLVLRVYGGRVPLAEFTDRDRDGRVDLLRLAYWQP